MGKPAVTTVDAAFADGMQRFSVEGWVGLVPIVRAHVGAAVLRRRDGRISPIEHRAEEFVVAPAAKLPTGVLEKLEETGLPIHVDEEPLTCVVRGAGRILDDMLKYRTVLVQ